MSEYTLCVFGAGGVGKSCLTIQFVQDVFTERYDPTIEDVYNKSIEVDEKTYSLQILDTAGSDEFSSMRDLYVKNGHGFVLVYSITSQATFNELNGYYDRILNVKDTNTQGPPAIILVGNKRDLERERVVSTETGQALAKKWNCSFLETTAKDRANVAEIFYDLVRQINRKSQVPRAIKPASTNAALSEEGVRILDQNSSSKPSPPTVGQKTSKCCMLF